MSTHVTIHHEAGRVERLRLDSTLANCALGLVLGDDDGVRAAYMGELNHRYVMAGGYLPITVRTPDTGTNAALLRAIVGSLGLTATRSRAPMWRALERRCADERKESGRVVLLLIDDVGKAPPSMFSLLHLLTTMTVGDDLALRMVLAGRSDLLVRLGERRHRALRSRIGFCVRLNALNMCAA